MAADSIAAREIVLTLENDGQYYRMYVSPYIKSLATKKAKGTYNATSALKGWRRLADVGVRKYAKDNRMNSRQINADTRNVIARALKASFDEEVNYTARELKPKRKAPAKRKPSTSLRPLMKKPSMKVKLY